MRESDSGWQLQRGSAEAYEEYFVPTFFAESAQRLIDFVKMTEGERALDVGCGTGIVARTVAPVVGPSGAVAGVDINEEMLTVAKRVSADIRPSIDWTHQDATSLAFPEETFDIVLCQQAMEYVPDRRVALSEIRRVLVSDGRLAFSLNRGLNYNRPFALFADSPDRQVGKEAGNVIRSSFVDLTVADVHSLMDDAGFRNANIQTDCIYGRYPSVDEMLHREVASSPLAEHMDDLSVERREKLVGDLTEALSSYSDSAGVVLPQPIYVVRAQV